MGTFGFISVNNDRWITMIQLLIDFAIDVKLLSMILGSKCIKYQEMSWIPIWFLFKCLYFPYTDIVSKFLLNRRAKPNSSKTPTPIRTASPSCPEDRSLCATPLSLLKYASPMEIIQLMHQRWRLIRIWVSAGQRRERMQWVVCWLTLERRIWSKLFLSKGGK